MEQRKKSIAILNKYKTKISFESYKRILEIIGTMAMEGFFLDEDTIRFLVRFEQTFKQEED